MQTRLLSFNFLAENCPARYISPLINKCASAFGVHITEKLPHESTHEQIDRELGVLGHIQVSMTY